MEDGDSIDPFLIEVKDYNQQSVNVGDLVPNSQIVSTTLDGLLDPYQGLATTFQLVSNGNSNRYSFDRLSTLLLQKEQRWLNQNAPLYDDAFAAAHNAKG